MISVLAQGSFEAYQAIAEHPHLVHRLDNPFRPERIGEAGYFFIPWVESSWMYATWLITLGVLLLWVYRRVNPASAFELSGTFLLMIGAIVLWFFRQPFPHPLALTLLGGFLLALLVSLAPLLSAAAVHQLPYFGVDDRYLIQLRDGSVRPALPYACAGVLLLGAWTLAPMEFKTASSLLSHWPVQGSGWGVLGLAMALAVLVSGVVGYHLVPWREVPGQFVLGGQALREVSNVFKMEGPASRSEVVLVGLGAFLVYVFTLFLSKSADQIAAADVGGLVLISLVAFAIIRAELGREAREADLPAHLKKRGSIY